MALRIVGPFRWWAEPDLFVAKEAQEPGVYVWTLETTLGELIYYVGQTGRTFVQRMNEHFCYYIDGTYEAVDLDELRRGRYVEVWEGTYRQRHKQRHADFVDRLAELLPLIHGLIRSFRFWLMPYRTEDQRLRCRIEGGIHEHVKSLDGAAASLLRAGEPIPYQYRDPIAEPPVRVSLSGGESILGFPTNLEV